MESNKSLLLVSLVVILVGVVAIFFLVDRQRDDDQITGAPIVEVPEDKVDTPDVSNNQCNIVQAYAFELRQPRNHNARCEDKRFNIGAVERVRAVGMITGEGSLNRTRSRYRVGGTDLGIFIEHKDKMYIFFGDTFFGDEQGNSMKGGFWRSNVLAYTTDFDASDGITFDGMIMRGGMAREMIGSRKIPGIEHTVIPTGGLSDGENMYVFYMSVKEWGAPGRWTINYGGLAKSTDDGNSFKKLPNVRFDGNKFGQIAPIIIGDYVYLIGIGSGRFGSARLMRVKLNSIELFEEYEYLIGFDGESPIFRKGSDYVKDSVIVVNGPVGEPSIIYNEYLDEYVLTYLKESIGAIVMRRIFRRLTWEKLLLCKGLRGISRFTGMATLPLQVVSRCESVLRSG